MMDRDELIDEHGYTVEEMAEWHDEDVEIFECPVCKKPAEGIAQFTEVEVAPELNDDDRPVCLTTKTPPMTDAGIVVFHTQEQKDGEDAREKVENGEFTNTPIE